MPRALSPRPSAQPPRSPARRTALPRDVVDELRQISKPGKADQAISRLERAVALVERQDGPGATSEAAKAKALAPRSPAVREVLGLALYEQGRYREALSEMQTYRRMSGRPDENHIIADCERAIGRPERAVPLAEEALAGRVPLEAKAEAVIVAASALADLGRFEQALALLRRVRTKSDAARAHDLRVWYVTADVLARGGRNEEAAREFRKILRHDPSAFDAAERLAQLG